MMDAASVNDLCVPMPTVGVRPQQGYAVAYVCRVFDRRVMGVRLFCGKGGACQTGE